jgi:hypothetical protein
MGTVTCDGIGMTDGPYMEGKEHIGGLVIIRARDLDEASRGAARWRWR